MSAQCECGNVNGNAWQKNKVKQKKKVKRRWKDERKFIKVNKFVILWTHIHNHNNTVKLNDTRGTWARDKEHWKERERKKHMRKTTTTKSAHAGSVQLSIYNYSRREANRVRFPYFSFPLVHILLSSCSCMWTISFYFARLLRKLIVGSFLVDGVTSLLLRFLFFVLFFSFMNLIYYLKKQDKKIIEDSHKK